MSKLKRVFSLSRHRAAFADQVAARIEGMFAAQLQAQQALTQELAQLRESLHNVTALQQRQDELASALLPDRHKRAELNAHLVAMQQEQQRMASLLAGLAQGQRTLAESLRKLPGLQDSARAQSELLHSYEPPRLKIHFFFQNPESWTSLESVYRACLAHPRLEATIVLLPFIHDSATDNQRARRFLADQQLPFIDHSVYDVARQCPDLVFFQSPYDSTRPEAYGAPHLRALGIRYAYIPYGLDVGGGQDNLHWQYDLDVQRHAWRVFARSEAHARMYALHCESGSQHVVVTGHPKIDRIVAANARQAQRPEALQDRKVILWTPHFSVEPGGWSTFAQHYEALLSYFEARPDGLALFVRPHPLFFGRLAQTDLFDEAGAQALRKRLHQPPYIWLDENPLYEESFQLSDALMADAGSFLLEYLPTGKPILYLPNAGGRGLNESGSFVEHYYQAADSNQIIDFIGMIARGQDPLESERTAQTQSLLHCIDGQVGTHIAHYIAGHLPEAASVHAMPITDIKQ